MNNRLTLVAAWKNIEIPQQHVFNAFEIGYYVA